MSRRSVETSLGSLVTIKEAAMVRRQQLAEEHQRIYDQLLRVERLPPGNPQRIHLERLRSLERDMRERVLMATDEIEQIEYHLYNRI